MMRGAIYLLAHVTPHCTPGHRRLVARVILPPFIDLPTTASKCVMKEWNISEKRMS
jgi:hypothetical protein